MLLFCLYRLKYIFRVYSEIYWIDKKVKFVIILSKHKNPIYNQLIFFETQNDIHSINKKKWKNCRGV